MIDKERVVAIGRKYNHQLYNRDGYYELVRQFGDQVDSRMTVKGDDEVEYYVWEDIHGRNLFSDTIYTNVTDYDFYEEVDKVLKKGNKLYKIELIERDVVV